MNATFRGPCPEPVRLSSLVDGELDHDDRDAALAHLATCPRCRASLEAERRTKAAVAELPPAPAPPELLARLHGMAGTSGPPVVPFVPTARSPRRGAASWLAVAASVAVFVAGGAAFLGALAESTPQRPSPDGLTVVVPAADLFVAEHAASLTGGPGDAAMTSVSTTYLVPAGSRVP